jgi:hypothetical protein
MDGAATRATPLLSTLSVHSTLNVDSIHAPRHLARTSAQEPGYKAPE